MLLMLVMMNVESCLILARSDAGKEKSAWKETVYKTSPINTGGDVCLSRLPRLMFLIRKGLA